jgi:hypothetical protein
VNALTILRNTGPTTLTEKWYENDLQVDAGTVTVGIVDAAGTVVVAPLTATTKTGSGATTAYSYDLAIQTTVKRLTVTWTRTDTGASLSDEVEVVGWHLFTVSQARSWDSAVMASTSAYPLATVCEERDRITDRLEDAIGWPPIQRYGQATVNGSGTDRIMLPTHRAVSVLAVTVDGVAFGASDLADLKIDGIMLIRDTGGIFTSGDRNVDVHYCWGPERPLADADRVGLYLLRDRLVPADISPRALSVSNDLGQVQFALPSARFPFGLPVVDQWVRDHNERRQSA